MIEQFMFESERMCFALNASSLFLTLSINLAYSTKGGGGGGGLVEKPKMRNNISIRKELVL